MAILRPYKGDKPFIFISYAHKDKGSVHKIIKNMLDCGYRVWYDEGIDPGTEWDDTIAEHVENCGYFIAFISKNYLASDNCMDELDYARDSNRKRLLVYLENVSLPGGMKMRLNRLQAIHKYKYESEDDFFEKLYTADQIGNFKEEVDLPPIKEKPTAKVKSATKKTPSPKKAEQKEIVITYPKVNIAPPVITPTEDFDWELLFPTSKEKTTFAFSDYKKPPTSLLKQDDFMPDAPLDEIHKIISVLQESFEAFKIKIKDVSCTVAPSFLRFEVTPEAGVSLKKILDLQFDLSAALGLHGLATGNVRIAIIPGKRAVGIEVPLKSAANVPLRGLLEDPKFKSANSPVTVCLGRDSACEPVFADINEMPHLLIGGQTRSGKSTLINCMITSLIYKSSPDDVRLLLIDPKMVEYRMYNLLPHLIMPVVDNAQRAVSALKWVVDEMDRRYKLLEKAQARNRKEYYEIGDNNPDFEPMPHLVVIIDELADLMLQAKNPIEEYINRIATLARACGIHLIICTQRPTVDVITGVIKANIPSKIAFKVASHVDSRTVLGVPGAENLIGHGDMLYIGPTGNEMRIQGANVDVNEIKSIVKYVIENNGSAKFDPDVFKAVQKSETVSRLGGDADFEMLCSATELFLEMGIASLSLMQRHLRIGFNKAANLFDKLVEIGFISQRNGSKPATVLITKEKYLEWKKRYTE